MASRGLNKVMLIGNLGADPEMRYTPNGKCVTTFRIAVNRTWRDQAGEQQQAVEWVPIVAWEKLAEICNKFLVKGKQVYIEGRLQTRSWEDQDGKRRYKTEVVAQQMLMLGSKSGGGDLAEPGEWGGEAALEEEDLPF